MSKSLGDFDTSAVIYGKFTTYQPSTGAAFALAGTPALSVYKDNSTTQSTSGVTLTASFDSVTGLNHFAIDTSTDGTFYSAGSFFDIVVTAGTVDSVSVVGSVVASFTIRKNSALKPATAGRTIVVDAAGLADANVVKLGPTGSGTAQTARDVGASVLLSSGTGTGQVSFTSGILSVNATQLAGSSTAATNLSGSAVTIALGTVDTAGFSPTTSAFETSSITEATADHFVGRIVIFRSGALLYQQALITAYALNSGRGKFTVTTMTDAPANGDTFAIL